MLGTHPLASVPAWPWPISKEVPGSEVALVLPGCPAPDDVEGWALDGEAHYALGKLCLL